MFALALVVAVAGLVPSTVVGATTAVATRVVGSAADPGASGPSVPAAPRPSRAPEATIPTPGPLPVLGTGGPVTGSVRFFGRGYGHGVGLSQYGARGRALDGQSAETILAHYYAGTSLAAVDPARLVRVLVLAAFAPTPTVPLTVHGRGGTWSVDGLAGTWPADGSVSVTTVTSTTGSTWRLTVRDGSGSKLASRDTCCSVRIRPVDPSTTLQLDSKPSSFDTYRGTLRLTGTATAVDVVDEVALDAYLKGVVPAEMPSGWPTQAVRAQAIAARSYAVRRLHPATGRYDVYDDSRTQTYRGVEAETARTNAIIDGDAGVVLLSGAAVANALYSSAAGGATENNEVAFASSTGTLVAGPVSYLRGSSDRRPDGSAYDATSPYASWATATYPIATISAILAKDARTAVGTVTAIDLSHRGVSGRLYRVTITGTLGTKSVSGEVFRAVFNAGRPAADPPMRSSLFDLAPIP